MRRGREAFEVLIANCKIAKLLIANCKLLVFDDTVEFEIGLAKDWTPGVYLPTLLLKKFY